jgi:hypothetical protein
MSPRSNSSGSGSSSMVSPWGGDGFFPESFFESLSFGPSAEQVAQRFGKFLGPISSGQEGLYYYIRSSRGESFKKVKIFTDTLNSITVRGIQGGCEKHTSALKPPRLEECPVHRTLF